MPANLYRGQDARDIAVYIAKCSGNPNCGVSATNVGAPPAATTTTAGGGGGSAKPDGKKVFTSAGCGGCHTLKDAGTSGNVGPNPAGGLVPAERSSNPAGRRRPERLLHIGRRHVQERNAGIRGNDRSRRIDAGLPAPLDHPDTRTHGPHHSTSRSESQRAKVAARSTGGTVTAPRRRNSMAGRSAPRRRRTRRQSRVASEPT